MKTQVSQFNNRVLTCWIHKGLAKVHLGQAISQSCC